MRGLPVTVTPEDYRKGVPGSPYACAIAQAARRQYGGKWRVESKATQRLGGRTRSWRVSESALAMMTANDNEMAVKGTHTVLLIGNPQPLRGSTVGSMCPDPPVLPRVRRNRKKDAAWAGAIAVAVLVLTGLAWVIALLFVLAVAALLAQVIHMDRKIRGPVRASKAPTAAPASSPRQSVAAPERARAPQPQGPEPVRARWPQIPPRGVPAAPEPVPAAAPGDGLPEPAPALEGPQRAVWPNVPAYTPDPAPAPEPLSEPVPLPDPVPEPVPVPVPVPEPVRGAE
jgi:hypothetical protein